MASCAGAGSNTFSKRLACNGLPGACSTFKTPGLVRNHRRAGYRVFYRLIQSEDPEVVQLLEDLMMALSKDKVLKADMGKLREAIEDGACPVSEWKPLSGLSCAQGPHARSYSSANLFSCPILFIRRPS